MGDTPLQMLSSVKIPSALQFSALLPISSEPQMRQQCLAVCEVLLCRSNAFQTEFWLIRFRGGEGQAMRDLLQRRVIQHLLKIRSPESLLM